MILFKKTIDLRNYLDSQVKKPLKTGFVPTMGALHEGHLSLIKRSKEENDLTVCSIFVNPAQFNDPEDFKKYPLTPENDINLLESIACDILFMPSVIEVYPQGIENHKIYELGNLELLLEGKHRPGHFQGVCMVVNRLLNMVQPDTLYLGQKDYQQCMVIMRLLKLLSKDNEIVVRVCPIVRETDGLAMSSRNIRLTGTERYKAGMLYLVLTGIKKECSIGTTEEIKSKAITSLEEAGFRVDYIEIADAGTLEAVVYWNGNQKIIALVAASIGNVRLIDNLLINLNTGILPAGSYPG